MRTYETKIALLEPSRSQSHRALGATLQQDAIVSTFIKSLSHFYIVDIIEMVYFINIYFIIYCV